MVEVGTAGASGDVDVGLVVLAHLAGAVRGQRLMLDVLNLWVFFPVVLL